MTEAPRLCTCGHLAAEHCAHVDPFFQSDPRCERCSCRGFIPKALVVRLRLTEGGKGKESRP